MNCLGWIYLQRIASSGLKLRVTIGESTFWQAALRDGKQFLYSDRSQKPR